MILRELNLHDKVAFEELLDVWDGAFGYSLLYEVMAEKKFENYLKLMNEMSRGINLPENHVPSTNLFAFDENVIVGKVSVRHHLNENLENVGGHIGYAVLPEHRKKGYASEMLKQVLSYCNQLGLHRVLVTCNENNIASAKVILKNGGVLENIFDPKDGTSKKLRYWIQI
jgi:predicted acetyltransferase